MSRRYFEYLYIEICVAVEKRISRYALWLLVWEAGGDPDDLTREQAHLFLEHHLDPLLREEGLRLTPRSRRRLVKRVLRFDPHHATPEEWLETTAQRLAS